MNNDLIKTQVFRFRAWDGEKMFHRVICGNTENDDPCSSVCTETGEWKEFDNHCGIITQSIGFKDKKGWWIFAGDILRMKDSEMKAIVGWYPEHACYGILCGYHYAMIPIAKIYYENEDEISAWEVIGNVFENPELLKEVGDFDERLRLF